MRGERHTVQPPENHSVPLTENFATLVSMRWKRLLAIIIFPTVPLVSVAYAQHKSPTAPAEAVLQRLMPHLAPQFELILVNRPDRKDYFRISGTRGHIRVEAATQPTVPIRS